MSALNVRNISKILFTLSALHLSERGDIYILNSCDNTDEIIFIEVELELLFDGRQLVVHSLNVDDSEDGVGVLDDRAFRSRFFHLHPLLLIALGTIPFFHQLLLGLPCEVASIEKQVKLFRLENCRR